MESPAYIVRTARVADLSSLPAIERGAARMFASTAYPEIAREPTSTVAEYRSWLERDALIVAVAPSGEPVGFAVAYEVDGDAYLHEIDVDPGHGRRGVGRTLVDFVKARAARQGYGRLTLSTFRDVPWNAPYYARLGFVELAEADAGPGLRALRDRERANGLAVEDRLFMACDLPRPGDEAERTPSTDVLVRDARRGDVRAIASLAREFAEYLHDLGDTAEHRLDAEALERDGFGPDPAFGGLVAEVSGRIVGYLLHHPGYDSDAACRLLFVVDLYVTRSARGRGIGASLLNSARTAAAASGAKQIVWTVDRRNASARRFYEKLGARYVERLDLMYLDV